MVRFEFVVNLRDCKGLGLTIPSMLDAQGEASLPGLKAEGPEQTGSQSYIPPDPKDDKALQTAVWYKHQLPCRCSDRPRCAARGRPLCGALVVPCSVMMGAAGALASTSKRLAERSKSRELLAWL